MVFTDTTQLYAKHSITYELEVHYIMITEATERSSLINKGTCCSRWIRRVKNRYSNSFVTSKRAILCLIWLGVQMNLDLAIWASWIVLIPPDKNTYLSETYMFMFSFIYLIYPVLGYIGERWTRYYVIMSGVVVSCLTTLVFQVMMLLKSFDTTDNNSTLVTEIAVSCLVGYGIGFGLVMANIIQFSIDQMQQASSEELASFTRWWVFTMSFSFSVSFSLFLFLISICNDSNDFARVVSLVLFIFSVPYFFIGICFKRYFVIEPPPTIDPLKLVYRVLKYAWKHKYPERRSAFTYSDNPPSRLDYCKDRYGGPFTTDQVESVRSFWYILTVIAAVSMSSGISVDILQINNIISNSSNLVKLDENLISFGMIPNLPLTLVPVFFQLLLFPVCPYLVPSMLKRILFGLILITLSYVTSTILVYPSISAAIDQSILLVFNIIGNFGSAIIKFTSLEFIFAQSPVHFQGLMIGVWSISFGQLSSIFLVNIFTRYCIATCLLCVSLLVYSIAMYCYKYRLRNELSDINRRQTVEEIYERDLNRRCIENNNDFSLDFSNDFLHHSIN